MSKVRALVVSTARWFMLPNPRSRSELVGADHPKEPSDRRPRSDQYFFLTSRRSTLPTVERGRAFQLSTLFGSLMPRRSLQGAMISASFGVAPRLETVG